VNVLVITYWSFKEPLIQAATLPYLRIMSELLGPESRIHLVTLEKQNLAIERDEDAAIREALDRDGITLLTRRYHKFGLRAMVSWAGNLLWIKNYCKRENIAVLHAFGSPAATTADMISRLTRLPYVIDSYEPHAESMVENGSWKSWSIAHRLLRWFERVQSRRARAVLATTEGMREYAAKTYGHIPGVFIARPACVDVDQFTTEHSPSRTRADLGFRDDDIVCVYAGKIGGIYLKQEVFDFFAVCAAHWGERFRVIMLSDLKAREMEVLAARSQLDAEKIYLAFVPHHTVASYLSLADFAINPVKPVPTKRYCTSIKDGEYWAMGLPVVIPQGISDDSDLIREEKIGVVLSGLHHEAYLLAVQELDGLLRSSRREAEKKRIRKLAITHRGMAIAYNAYRLLYGQDGVLRKRNKRFLVLIYNSYRDPLFRNLVFEYMLRQSELNLNYHFDLITFEQKKYALNRSERKQERIRLSAYRVQWHALTYHSGAFMLVKKAFDFAAALYNVVSIRARFKTDMVIAFANTSAAISLLLSRWIGAKLMVYSFEPHSEFLAEFGVWNRSGWRYRILNRLEERVGREAAYLLTGTQHMVDRMEGVASGQVFRAPSSVDEQMFKLDLRAREAGRSAWNLVHRRVLIYAGKFGGIYYNREIADFCARLLALDRSWFFIFLTPSPAAEVTAVLDEAGLDVHDYRLTEAKSAREVVAYLSMADIGLTAIPPYPNQKFRSPVKVGEYLMCGLPYITCRGVSEDDTWAENHRVGIVVDTLSATVAEDVQKQALILLSENIDSLRERCRATGIAYRGRKQVDELFDKILAEA
jgi:glycosyltransferase involved in cell wall biosynthesis